jgi:hypothetical protein
MVSPVLVCGCGDSVRRACKQKTADSGIPFLHELIAPKRRRQFAAAYLSSILNAASGKTEFAGFSGEIS